jgi:hypothetical protein
MEQSEQSQSPQAQSSRTVMSQSQRREYWQDIFARHAASGLSIKVFCEQEKVSYQGFFDYKRRLRDTPIQSQEKITFAPVTVVPQKSVASEGIEIVLSGDRRVIVRGPVDRLALLDVLEVLSSGAA